MSYYKVVIIDDIKLYRDPLTVKWVTSISEVSNLSDKRIPNVYMNEDLCDEVSEIIKEYSKESDNLVPVLDVTDTLEEALNNLKCLITESKDNNVKAIISDLESIFEGVSSYSPEVIMALGAIYSIAKEIEDYTYHLAIAAVTCPIDYESIFEANNGLLIKNYQ